MNHNKLQGRITIGDNAEAEAFFAEQIAERGCFITVVPYGKIPIAVTTGLFEKGWPEIVVTGIDMNTVQEMIKALVDRNECPVAGEVSLERMEGKAKLTALSGDASEQFLSVARAYRMTKGGYEVEALQLVFADEEGLWPDDVGCDPMSRKCQILLDRFHK